MSKPVPQIALTGSIGSGKSAVAELFKDWGSSIVDADVYAHELLQAGTTQTRMLIEKFGAQITRPDHSLDRFALRSLVFLDASARKELEALLHPEIRIRMLEKCQELIKNGAISITMVIPLLFEAGDCDPKKYYPNLTQTVVVTAPRDICIKRASARDQCSPKIIASIFDAQLSPEQKQRRANYVIDNSGSQEELRKNAKVVFDTIHAV